CVKCGFVVDENEIDHGPEWRSHTADEREQRSRVGSPTTKMLHDDGVSSEIGWRNVDAYGNSLSSRQRQKMNRLRTWHTLRRCVWLVRQRRTTSLGRRPSITNRRVESSGCCFGLDSKKRCPSTTTS